MFTIENSCYSLIRFFIEKSLMQTLYVLNCIKLDSKHMVLCIIIFNFELNTERCWVNIMSVDSHFRRFRSNQDLLDFPSGHHSTNCYWFNKFCFAHKIQRIPTWNIHTCLLSSSTHILIYSHNSNKISEMSNDNF